MQEESLIIIFLALAIGSIVKGVAGLGLPLTAIPVMAGYMDVDRAVAIMVLPGIISQFWLLWAYREHAVRIAYLPTIVCLGVMCVALGAWILSQIPQKYLLFFVCLWLGGYLLRVFLNKWLKLRFVNQRLSALIATSVAGFVQGAVGMAGPIVASYVHSLDLKQPQYVFVVSIFFQIFLISQLISFTWLGLMNGERVFESLVACIPIAIFLPIAIWLSRYISDKTFNVLLVGLLIMIEGRLIWRLIF